MYRKRTVIYVLIFVVFECHGNGESRERHFPGYHFCGPGTNFLERVSKGQLGVNKLDEACRSHDSVYTKSEDTTLRNEADLKLEMDAWERVKAKDSSYTEKIVAWMVTNVMKMKRKWNTRSTREIRDLSLILNNTQYSDDHHIAWFRYRLWQ